MKKTGNSAALYADVDIGDWEVFMRAVKNTRLPDSARDALNSVADAVTVRQNRNIKREMIVRSRYTMRSTQNPRARPYKALNKAQGRNMKRMFSRSGTFSPYLWLQENDTTVRGLSGPVPIPQLAARTGRSIRKSIARRYRLPRSARLRKTPGSREIGRTAAGSVWVGLPKGLHRGRKRPFGIYERRGKFRLRMLRSLESDTARIKGTRFHADAVARYGTEAFISEAFARELRRRLRR